MPSMPGAEHNLSRGIHSGRIGRTWNKKSQTCGCFLMVVPPKHPKMIIFSRKTNGCLVLYHHFRKPPCQVQAIKKSPSHPPCDYRGTFGAQKHLPSGSSTKTFRRNEDKAITWFPKGETSLKLSGLEVEIRLSSARHAEQSCLGMDKSQSALTQHCISTGSFRSKEISSTLNHLRFQKINPDCKSFLVYM